MTNLTGSVTLTRNDQAPTDLPETLVIQGEEFGLEEGGVETDSEGNKFESAVYVYFGDHARVQLSFYADAGCFNCQPLQVDSEHYSLLSNNLAYVGNYNTKAPQVLILPTGFTLSKTAFPLLIVVF